MIKKVLIILGIIAVPIILTGCSKKENKETISELDKILNENNYIIVDVRTKEEYETGHVVGAINIPYDEIDENTDLDKTKTIIVYCKSGARSNKAYQTLKSLNYIVYDLGAYDKINLDKE